jgi:hypothetical protein
MIDGYLFCFVIGLLAGGVAGAWCGRRKPCTLPQVSESSATPTSPVAVSPRYIVILRAPLSPGTLFKYPDEAAEADVAFHDRLRDAYKYDLEKVPRYFVGAVDGEREFRLHREVQRELGLDRKGKQDDDSL